MTGSFAAESPLPRQQFFKNKPISHPGSDEFHPLFPAGKLDPQIRHQRSNHTLAITSLVTILTQNEQNSVAIHEMTLLIHEHDPVGISIKGDSNVSTALANQVTDRVWVR